ncbi:hypothetical protein D9M68_806490 [compost metagenome]
MLSRLGKGIDPSGSEPSTSASVKWKCGADGTPTRMSTMPSLAWLMRALAPISNSLMTSAGRSLRLMRRPARNCLSVPPPLSVIGRSHASMAAAQMA